MELTDFFGSDPYRAPRPPIHRVKELWDRAAGRESAYAKDCAYLIVCAVYYEVSEYLCKLPLLEGFGVRKYSPVCKYTKMTLSIDFEKNKALGERTLAQAKHVLHRYLPDLIVELY